MTTANVLCAFLGPGQYIIMKPMKWVNTITNMSIKHCNQAFTLYFRLRGYIDHCMGIEWKWM